MSRYFVRTVDNKWEEISEYVFNNRKFAVTENGDSRYSDVSVVVDNSSVKINGELSLIELGKVCRFLRVTIPSESFSSALYSEPEVVKIKRGNSTLLHYVKTGENYKAVRSSSKVSPEFVEG